MEKHFYEISQEYAKPYLNLSEKFITSKSQWPKLPKSWRDDVSGWTRYNNDGTLSSVDAPLEDCFTFDVEVCVLEGHHPVIASAMSKEAWYSWISPHLIDKTRPKLNSLKQLDLIKGKSKTVLNLVLPKNWTPLKICKNIVILFWLPMMTFVHLLSSRRRP